MKNLGILAKDIDESYIFNKKYLDCFNEINCIGIFRDSSYDICDAYFIQGGNNIESWYFDVIDHAVEYNKPILGICLGCQVLGLYGDKTSRLSYVNNHYNTYHNISIEKDTFLYELFGSNILVNSRHKECISKLSSSFDAIAVSSDGIIEAIKYKSDKNFIVGIQFHPEDFSSMHVIYDTFIKYVVK